MGTFDTLPPLDGFSDNSYNTRNLQSVYLPSGEIYLFYVEQCPDGANLAYDMRKNINGVNTIALTTGYSGKEIPIGLRVIAGHHVRKGEVTGLKWVGYKNYSNPNQILPFIEAYAISVTYKKETNRLDLFFWSNILFDELDPTYVFYDYEHIAVQKELDSFIVNGESKDSKSVKKRLFHAEGSFVKANVDAQIIEGALESTSVDYIPVFEFPEPVMIFNGDDSRVNDFSGSGLKYFEVVEEKADYLVCYPVSEVDSEQMPSGDTTLIATVNVAKPWMLRTTPFNGKTRDGISYETQPSGYVYEDLPINLRKATKDTTEEWQRITPDYTMQTIEQRGEIIAASSAAPFDIIEGEETITISLCEVNMCGRCWAETDEPPTP